MLIGGQKVSIDVFRYIERPMLRGGRLRCPSRDVGYPHEKPLNNAYPQQYMTELTRVFIQKGLAEKVGGGGGCQL